MKQFFKSHVILFSMIAVLIGCLIYPNRADAKTYQTQDNYIGGGGCSVVISGNKVYYSITETGKIFCYDIKTKKTKTIAKAGGKGFRSLRKKGNYDRIAKEHPELAEKFKERRHLLDEHLKEKHPEVYELVVKLREKDN